MKALVLQIKPTKKQYGLLDEAFNKWASICNRISLKGKTKDDLRPNSNFKDKIQFSSTQLNQAETDISDLQRAMKGLKRQKEEELTSLKERYETINNALNDDTKREFNPQKSSNIRPKGWRK